MAAESTQVQLLMERALEMATAKATAATLRSHGNPYEWAEADYQDAVKALRDALVEAFELAAQR